MDRLRALSLWLGKRNLSIFVQESQAGTGGFRQHCSKFSDRSSANL